MRQSTAVPSQARNDAATVTWVLKLPSAAGSSQVPTDSSHRFVPVTQTDRSTDDWSRPPKPRPATVTVASSARSVDGVTVIDGGGGRGVSGSKWSTARPAREESGRKGDATRAHGASAPRQSTSPAGVDTNALTRTCVVNAPAASGMAYPGSHMHVSGSSPRAAHWLNWRYSSANPVPDAVTDCPWTRPSAGVTTSAGGTTSVAGSKVSGTRADLAGLRLPLLCTTTRSHAPATRQSTDPPSVSITASRRIAASAASPSSRYRDRWVPMSQSVPSAAPAAHCMTEAYEDHTRPAARTVTDCPWTYGPVGVTDAVGGGARGPWGSNGRGALTVATEPSVVAYSTRTEHGVVRQSTSRAGTPSKPPTGRTASSRTVAWTVSSTIS